MAQYSPDANEKINAEYEGAFGKCQSYIWWLDQILSFSSCTINPRMCKCFIDNCDYVQYTDKCADSFLKTLCYKLPF